MSLAIGNVKLEGDLIFAPIAGFSDVGFRFLCAEYGASLTCTELVSAKGLVYGNKGTDPLLAHKDRPCTVQLFGCDPEFMFRAAADERVRDFDIVDINLGCPVKKVFNNKEGSALMQYPSLIEELVQAAREGSKKPVTVKLRAGITMGKPLAVPCALAAERGGASAVTVHPRYREQFYSGLADHSITRDVKQAVRIPVIANGDIASAEDLQRVKRETGADGFMIARAALGRPYIFSELSGRAYVFKPLDAICTHIDMLLECMPAKTVANLMKPHICSYAKGFGFAKDARRAAAEAKCLDDIRLIAERFFAGVEVFGGENV